MAIGIVSLVYGFFFFLRHTALRRGARLLKLAKSRWAAIQYTKNVCFQYELDWDSQWDQDRYPPTTVTQKSVLGIKSVEDRYQEHFLKWKGTQIGQTIPWIQEESPWVMSQLASSREKQIY